MIKAFSQRLMPPYSGQVQIAESDRARALTMDGETWEVHFRYVVNDNASFRRAADFQHADIPDISKRSSPEHDNIDERILELIDFLADAELPFPAADRYEYWLLDASDGSPLALIFTCTDSEQMATYPEKTEWTALPAAVMPIEATEDETASASSPVNYLLERLVAERAGNNPKARWFVRTKAETEDFPQLLVREDWDNEADTSLCRRYIERQSTRLLMLHGLTQEVRKRLEIAAKAHIFEVARFFHLYPAVADEKLMNAIRVEARLREAEGHAAILDRRDGVLYQ